MAAATEHSSGAGPESGDVTAGVSLIGAALLSVLAMAHHPAGAHAGGLAGIVHGVMIAVLAVLFYGFAHVALRRGLGRPVMLAGLTAYGVSLAAHLGAATINGFVVPALAARGSGAVSHEIFILCWETNQALAKLGVFATGTAFILWSAEFLRRPGAVSRTIGALGLLAGLLPAGALSSGILSMDVKGALAIYTAHAAWTVLVGVQLIRRDV